MYSVCIDRSDAQIYTKQREKEKEKRKREEKRISLIRGRENAKMVKRAKMGEGVAIRRSFTSPERERERGR